MYNRLFTKILDSSIWLEPTTTRIVWITLLAAMDENGYAHFSAIENLASRARIPIKETEKAVEVLSGKGALTLPLSRMNNPSVVPAVKTGWQTSEFWVTALASLIALLNTALGWQIDPTSIATVGGMIAAYALSRMGTKRSAVAAANDANTVDALLRSSTR